MDLKDPRPYLIVAGLVIIACAWGAYKHATCKKCQSKAAAIYQRSALRGYNGPEPQ